MGNTKELTTEERIAWMAKNDPDLWADWMEDDEITSENLPEWLNENNVPTHGEQQ